VDIEALITTAVDCGYKIHTGLGPGLLESAYQIVLVETLRRRGLSVEPERLIPIVFDGIVIENGFRADIVVEGKLLIELKSIEKLAPIHGKQLLTYLRLAGLPVGLLMNFGQPTFKEGLRRIADGYDDRNTAYRRAALQKS
jgi:GxxExxY protein